MPAALLRRSRWIFVATALPLVVFVGLFGPASCRASARRRLGTPLRVATFNLLYVNANLDRQIEAIRAEHADVVALQELVPPAAEAMQRDLKDIYPYQSLIPSTGVGGLGILSRYVLEPVERVDAGQGQWVIARVGEHKITIVNVHLHFSGISRIRSQRFGWLSYFRMSDTSGRLIQADGLRQAARTVGGGLIMLGDFNTGDREPGHAVLASICATPSRRRAPGSGSPSRTTSAWDRSPSRFRSSASTISGRGSRSSRSTRT